MGLGVGADVIPGKKGHNPVTFAVQKMSSPRLYIALKKVMTPSKEMNKNVMTPLCFPKNKSVDLP